ncbi:MAG: hypothetical protein ABIG63_01060 [Chloroflexota bacterium]
MEPHSGPFRWFKIFTICLLSLFLFSPIFQIPSQAAPEPSPEQAVQAVQHAWELAQEIGIYHFTTDVEQTTYPAPAIANVGRSSSIQTYYLEGDVDSPAQAFYMTLWQGGGNAATQKDGIEIRMEGGEAYGRPIGGLWQEIDDFSGLFAPGSDPMAYLAGAKNITLVSSHTQYALRYMFDLDGPAFAAHMRDLLEDQLRRSGELPPGLSLDSSILYREMTGLGEIWLDAQGLPLRLLVDLEMPDPKTGERVSARIKTDFSNFAQQPETAIGFIAEIPTWDWGLILPQVAFWGLFCSGIIVFVLFRHSQKVYAALVIALIFSMVGTPLLQSAQVAAFYETQEQKQLEFESAQNERAANQEARDELLTSSWDPHQNPVFSDQSSVFSLQSSVPNPQSQIFNLSRSIPDRGQSLISNLQVSTPTWTGLPMRSSRPWEPRSMTRIPMVIPSTMGWSSCAWGPIRSPKTAMVTGFLIMWKSPVLWTSTACTGIWTPTRLIRTRTAVSIQKNAINWWAGILLATANVRIRMATARRIFLTVMMTGMT